LVKEKKPPVPGTGGFVVGVRLVFTYAYAAPGLVRRRRRRLSRRRPLRVSRSGDPEAFERQRTGVRFLLMLIRRAR